jgi:hypothetical protein
MARSSLIAVGKQDYVVGVNAALKFDPRLPQSPDDSFVLCLDEQSAEHFHCQDEQER